MHRYHGFTVELVLNRWQHRSVTFYTSGYRTNVRRLGARATFAPPSSVYSVAALEIKNRTRGAFSRQAKGTVGECDTWGETCLILSEVPSASTPSFANVQKYMMDGAMHISLTMTECK